MAATRRPRFSPSGSPQGPVLSPFVPAEWERQIYTSQPAVDVAIPLTTPTTILDLDFASLTPAQEPLPGGGVGSTVIVEADLYLTMTVGLNTPAAVSFVMTLKRASANDLMGGVTFRGGSELVPRGEESALGVYRLAFRFVTEQTIIQSDNLIPYDGIILQAFKEDPVTPSDPVEMKAGQTQIKIRRLQ